jgi:hypothetical protein
MSDEDLNFRQAITLRDGRAALIRVMRPDDKERLQRAFAKLDPQSVYTRFFSARKSIPERAFERIAEIDFVNLAGLVVTIGCGADETVIGVPATSARSGAGGAREAEVAFALQKLEPRCWPPMRRCWRCSSAAGCRCADAARVV